LLIGSSNGLKTLIIILLFFCVVYCLAKATNRRLSINYFRLSCKYYSDTYESLILNGKILEDEKIQQLKLLLDYARNNHNAKFVPRRRNLDKFYKKYKKGIDLKGIQLISKTILESINIDYQFLEVKIYEINQYHSGALGYFIPRGLFGGEINISISSSYDIKFLLAVIIHECMHYYQHVRQISIDEQFEEKFTDLLAVFLGFGKYLILGYQTLLINSDYALDNLKSLTAGYLSVEELSYIERLIF